MSNPMDVRNSLTPTAVGSQGTNDAEQRKIKDLAQQFEAMLMSQMLREMRRSMLSGLEDENKGDGFGGDALMDTINVQLGLALSRAGGFGLSSVLLGGLERLTGPAKPEDVSNAVREITNTETPALPASVVPADTTGFAAPMSSSLPVQ